MAEVDTSSYPKPSQGKSVLETAGQLGALQQQAQGIERTGVGIASDKLKLMNEHFQIMNNELGLMANDPSITKDKVLQRLNNIATTLNMPPQVKQHMLGEFSNLTPEQLPAALEHARMRGMAVNEHVNFAYGQKRNVETGQTTTPVVESVRPGFQQRAIGPTVQKQLPPEFPTVEPGTGQPRALGAQPYQPPPGPLPVGPITNPAAMGQSNNFGGNVSKVEVGPNLPVQPLTASGPTTAPTPMFEEGKKQLANDQEVAKAKLTAIRPALEALPLIKELGITGIGSDKLNKVVAGLSNLGWVTQGTTDKVAAYQEVNKKLAQYVGQSGSRSDADLANREAGSPSARTQIQPALLKLVKDSIALDRAQAIMPGAFKDRDFSKYGAHSSTFPAKIDQRVLKLDMMEPEERAKLAKEMFEKKNTYEGKKFWDTYKLAREQNIIDLSGF